MAVALDVICRLDWARRGKKGWLSAEDGVLEGEGDWLNGGDPWARENERFYTKVTRKLTL